MGKISDELLKAINILIDKKISSLPLYREVDGKIIDKSSSGYLVSIEGEQINIPTFGYGEFKKNDTVKVCIPQNNMKNAYITVPLSDFGTMINKIENNTTNASTYSNQETLIGSYYDKNLYRRCFEKKMFVVGATSWAVMGEIAPGLEVKSLTGTFCNDNVNIYPLLTSGSWHLRYENTTGKVYIYNPSSSTTTFYKINVIIEYAKDIESR